MDSSVGTTTGPPADRLYAVEPVGVENTMPSAAYVATGSPFADTLRPTTRAKPPLCSTTSLSANHRLRLDAARVDHARLELHARSAR